MQWVIENELARSSRPGYMSGQPTQPDMDKWLQAARQMRIRSVICLLEDRELAYYDYLDLSGKGLLGWYQNNGLLVHHIQAEDRSGIPLSFDQLTQVWDVFQRLKKPVLVHCSAGIDRTGAAVKHIIQKMNIK